MQLAFAALALFVILNAITFFVSTEDLIRYKEGLEEMVEEKAAGIERTQALLDAWDEDPQQVQGQLLQAVRERRKRNGSDNTSESEQ